MRVCECMCGCVWMCVDVCGCVADVWERKRREEKGMKTKEVTRLSSSSRKKGVGVGKVLARYDIRRRQLGGSERVVEREWGRPPAEPSKCTRCDAGCNSARKKKYEAVAESG